MEDRSRVQHVLDTATEELHYWKCFLKSVRFVVSSAALLDLGSILKIVTNLLLLSFPEYKTVLFEEHHYMYDLEKAMSSFRLYSLPHWVRKQNGHPPHEQEETRVQGNGVRDNWKARGHRERHGALICQARLPGRASVMLTGRV